MPTLYNPDILRHPTFVVCCVQICRSLNADVDCGFSKRLQGQRNHFKVFYSVYFDKKCIINVVKFNHGWHFLRISGFSGFAKLKKWNLLIRKFFHLIYSKIQIMRKLHKFGTQKSTSVVMILNLKHIEIIVEGQKNNWPITGFITNVLTLGAIKSLFYFMRASQRITILIPRVIICLFIWPSSSKAENCLLWQHNLEQVVYLCSA